MIGDGDSVGWWERVGFRIALGPYPLSPEPKIERDEAH
jgi:hypothetical protein